MSAMTNSRPADEAALVRAVQAGETAAFEALLDAHLDHPPRVHRAEAAGGASDQ